MSNFAVDLTHSKFGCKSRRCYMQHPSTLLDSKRASKCYLHSWYEIRIVASQTFANSYRHVHLHLQIHPRFHEHLSICNRIAHSPIRYRAILHLNEHTDKHARFHIVAHAHIFHYIHVVHQSYHRLLLIIYSTESCF